MRWGKQQNPADINILAKANQMVKFPPKTSIFSNFIFKQLYIICHEMKNHSLKKEVVSLHTLQIHL